MSKIFKLSAAQLLVLAVHKTSKDLRVGAFSDNSLVHGGHRILFWCCGAFLWNEILHSFLCIHCFCHMDFSMDLGITS